MRIRLACWIAELSHIAEHPCPSAPTLGTKALGLARTGQVPPWERLSTSIALPRGGAKNSRPSLVTGVLLPKKPLPCLGFNLLLH